ncbi:MAG: hypothetical protein JWN37_270 [Candidatus Nomurabacteria bacterium]|nr:hypothetical protein [Candidatus Nomurabacteria bacterium]
MPPQESNQASNQPTSEPVIPIASIPTPTFTPPPVAPTPLPTTPPVPPVSPVNVPPASTDPKKSHLLPVLLGILLLVLIAAGGYAYYKWGQAPAEQSVVVLTPQPVKEEKKVEAIPTVSSPISLSSGGLGIVSFGSSTIDVIAKISSVYGTSTKDTGWTSSFSTYGTCPGKQIRVVEWGKLKVFFGDTVFGKQSFFHYEYTNNSTTTVGSGITTGTGLTLDVSEDLLKNLYPTAQITTDQNNTQWFTLGVNASTTASFLGTINNGKIASIAGGIQCGE